MSSYFQRWLIAASFVIGLDQLIKWRSQARFASQVQLNLVGAFSFGGFNLGHLNWLYLTGLVLIGLLIYLSRPSRITQNNWLAWALVWGGGMSNWLDRLIYGGVRDIWPILGTNLKNNLADYALTFGIIWLMIDSLRQRPNSKS